MEEIKNEETKNQEAWSSGDLAYFNGKGPMKGLLTIYIDVGQLPPFKAEAFIHRLMDRWKPVLERLPKDHGAIFIPVRPNSESRTEYLSFE